MTADRLRDPWRPIVPAQPVIVRLQYAFPPDSGSWRKGLPLWVIASGFDVADDVPGMLHAWVLSHAGRWWAYVAFEVRSRNGFFALALDQLVPAQAVQPARVEYVIAARPAKAVPAELQTSLNRPLASFTLVTGRQ